MRRTLVVSAVIAWVMIVGVGIEAIAAYSTTPGDQGATPDRWPADSAIGREADRATLVMFVHPQCPCSRSSLSELGAIAADSAARDARIVVAFTRPPGVTRDIDDWMEGATWDAAARIPGVRRVIDDRGVEAKRFGALSSGMVVLYDAGGTLRFVGGITGSRGHAGDNMGRRTVLAILADHAGDPSHPVYGCGMGIAHQVAR